MYQHYSFIVEMYERYASLSISADLLPHIRFVIINNVIYPNTTSHSTSIPTSMNPRSPIRVVSVTSSQPFYVLPLRLLIIWVLLLLWIIIQALAELQSRRLYPRAHEFIPVLHIWLFCPGNIHSHRLISNLLVWSSKYKAVNVTCRSPLSSDQGTRGTLRVTNRWLLYNAKRCVRSPTTQVTICGRSTNTDA
jgi:hypothetical protein